MMLVSAWLFIICRLATSQTLSFNNKDAIKGVPLKDTQSPQKSRAVMLLFLLHIAVHYQLFISNKAAMATGSICLPAWRPELPDSSRGLAGSYVRLSLTSKKRRNYKETRSCLQSEATCAYQSFIPAYIAFPIYSIFHKTYPVNNIHYMLCTICELRLHF